MRPAVQIKKEVAELREAVPDQVQIAPVVAVTGEALPVGKEDVQPADLVDQADAPRVVAVADSTHVLS
jgi:hypothetical protein